MCVIFSNFFLHSFFFSFCHYLFSFNVSFSILSSLIHMKFTFFFFLKEKKISWCEYKNIKRTPSGIITRFVSCYIVIDR